MPFKSRSQQRLFFAKEERGELPKGTAERWAHHTPNIKSLPEHKKRKRRKHASLPSVLDFLKDLRKQAEIGTDKPWRLGWNTFPELGKLEDEYQKAWDATPPDNIQLNRRAHEIDDRVKELVGTSKSGPGAVPGGTNKLRRAMFDWELPEGSEMPSIEEAKAHVEREIGANKPGPGTDKPFLGSPRPGFMQAHAKELGIGLGALAAAGGGYGLYKLLHKRKKEAAAHTLGDPYPTDWNGRVSRIRGDLHGVEAWESLRELNGKSSPRTVHAVDYESVERDRERLKGANVNTKQASNVPVASVPSPMPSVPSPMSESHFPASRVPSPMPSISFPASSLCTDCARGPLRGDTGILNALGSQGSTQKFASQVEGTPHILGHFWGLCTLQGKVNPLKYTGKQAVSAHSASIAKTANYMQSGIAPSLHTKVSWEQKVSQARELSKQAWTDGNVPQYGSTGPSPLGVPRSPYALPQQTGLTPGNQGMYNDLQSWLNQRQQLLRQPSNTQPGSPGVRPQLPGSYGVPEQPVTGGLPYNGPTVGGAQERERTYQLQQMLAGRRQQEPRSAESGLTETLRARSGADRQLQDTLNQSPEQMQQTLQSDLQRYNALRRSPTADPSTLSAFERRISAVQQAMAQPSPSPQATPPATGGTGGNPVGPAGTGGTTKSAPATTPTPTPAPTTPPATPTRPATAPQPPPPTPGASTPPAAPRGLPASTSQQEYLSDRTPQQNPTPQQQLQSPPSQQQPQNPLLQQQRENPVLQQRLLDPTFQQQLQNPTFRQQQQNPMFQQQLQNPMFQQQLQNPMLGQQQRLMQQLMQIHQSRGGGGGFGGYRPPMRGGFGFPKLGAAGQGGGNMSSGAAPRPVIQGTVPGGQGAGTLAKAPAATTGATQAKPQGSATAAAAIQHVQPQQTQMQQPSLGQAGLYNPMGASFQHRSSPPPQSKGVYMPNKRAAFFEKVALIDLALGGPLGAMSAPEGKKWEGAARGSSLGHGILSGASHSGTVGGLTGLGAGALLGLPFGRPIEGAGLGAGAGGLLGAIYGGTKGYEKAKDVIGKPSWEHKKEKKKEKGHKKEARKHHTGHNAGQVLNMTMSPGYMVPLNVGANALRGMALRYAHNASEGRDKVEAAKGATQGVLSGSSAGLGGMLGLGLLGGLGGAAGAYGGSALGGRTLGMGLGLGLGGLGGALGLHYGARKGGDLGSALAARLTDDYESRKDK